jgi:GAF domain-containing protein/HAMP domain-containing protein
VKSDQRQTLPSETSRQKRNAFNFSLALSVPLLIAVILLFIREDTRILPLAILALAVSVVSARLALDGRHILGGWLVVSAFSLIGLFLFFQNGYGVYISILLLLISGGVAFGALPAQHADRAMAVGALAAIFILGMEQLIPARQSIGGVPQNITLFLSVVTFFLFLHSLLRSFAAMDLRTKIILGILATGGIALGVLSFFAIDRVGRITDSLSERLETNVRLLAEEQLINTAHRESDRANQFFDELMKDINNLAGYRVALQNQRETLSQGTYWNAASNLVKLEGGQYGNSAQDISSVFVPASIGLDESALTELNISAYLDFSIPQLLNENPAILAIYFIDSRGIVRYYPNIELASVLPPDFDATKRPYYEINTPLYNPQRLTRWTIPYVDATGGGLVVTVAAPVYYGDEFNGVVAADVQLSVITEQISSIRIGQTGYAFMIDDAGRIISMPPDGYEMFEVDSDEFPADEFFKQTVLGSGTQELRSISNRMVAGGRGLGIVRVNWVETYISYAPVNASGYTLALVVPVSEMQTAIIAARNETQAQIRSAFQISVLILAILFVGALIVSLALGQAIAAPVRRLTETASRIAGGDLTVKADSATRDEIGTLANAFNTMTARLRETLEGLEQTVADRTAELVKANEWNERRAKHFESIAHVARTISSTRDLDSLLPQITTAINREFGFYHVGIFLVDIAREYAVLSAANSEGGQVMLARGHRLKIGEVGIVGYVTGTGQPRVALDVGTDSVFFDNPDLPDTRSEMALPLRAGEEIIGALDVQSKEPNAFSQEDINILSTLADQVSIAIQNARQYEETRKALGESEALARAFVQTGWQQFIKRRKLAGIRHTGAKATLLYTENGGGRGESHSETGQLRSRGRGAVLSLPVKLRGEVIGSVNVRAPDNRQWDRDELDIIHAIIERAALAMENARLLHESQRRAAREAKVSEVTAKIGASINMRNVLQTAVEELGRALPGSEVVIQFQSDRDDGSGRPEDL